MAATFGFHEIFHTLVTTAAAVHFVAIAGWVVPLGTDALQGVPGGASGRFALVGEAARRVAAARRVRAPSRSDVAGCRRGERVQERVAVDPLAARERSAVTVAVRGMRSSRPISPKYVSAPIVRRRCSAPGSPRAVTPTAPSRIT